MTKLYQWINLYEKAYLIAEDEQIIHIILSLIGQLQEDLPALQQVIGETEVNSKLYQMMEALKHKDYVRIHDLLDELSQVIQINAKNHKNQ